MKYIPGKYLENSAKELIDKACVKEVSINTTVEDFGPTTSLKLLDMLWYAKSKGVEIIFDPYFKD